MYLSVVYCTGSLTTVLAPKIIRCVPIAGLDFGLQVGGEKDGGGDQLLESLVGRHRLVEPGAQRTPPVSIDTRGAWRLRQQSEL